MAQTPKPKPTSRTCTRCKVLKPIGDFYSGKYMCKPCFNKRDLDYGRLTQKKKQELLSPEECERLLAVRKFAREMGIEKYPQPVKEMYYQAIVIERDTKAHQTLRNLQKEDAIEEKAQSDWIIIIEPATIPDPMNDEWATALRRIKAMYLNEGPKKDAGSKNTGDAEPARVS